MIDGDPEIVGNPRHNTVIRRFPLRVEKVRLPGETWENSGGRIDVRWFGPAPVENRAYNPYAGAVPVYGERWLVKGRTRTYYPQKHRFSGCSLSTGKHSSEKLSDGPAYAFARFLLSARRAAAGLLAVGIEDHTRTTGVLRALLLGYRNELNRDTHDLFAVTGTLHIFAISGLHVGIICGLLIFLLSVLGIPRTKWILFLAPSLIAYTFATGAKASAVRACIMALIYFSAPFAGRRADSLSALALAALLIIAWSPLQLFRVGFILSFTVVLGLIVLYPLVYRVIERLVGKVGILSGAGTDSVMPLFWERDPARVQEEPKPLPVVRRAVRHLSSLLALSCSAWLVSAPLTAYYFGRFSPVALLANVLVIPLAFLIVLTGCLSLVLGSCVALMADIFNHTNLILVATLLQGMKLISCIPGGSITVARPPLWIVVAWYSALGTIVYAVSERTASAKVIDNRVSE